MPQIKYRIVIKVSKNQPARQKPDRCLSENHYCPMATEFTVLLDDYSHRNATFIPRSQDGINDGPIVTGRCKWTVKIKAPENQQVLVQRLPGIPAKNSIKRNSSLLQNVLISNQKGLNDEIRSASFSVHSAQKRSKFEISITWEAGSLKSYGDLDNVRVMLPIPGYCSRTMLAFNGKCYAMSAVEQNVTDAMSSVRGDAQLASFSSMTDICEFVA
uniref:CUB domain-containing protein n=1 Tax=Macrostomum lignano TaxID=282301 RepID=A0A1I8I906_9PLAT